MITGSLDTEVTFLLENPDVLAQRIAQLEKALTALREISAVRLPTGNAVGRDELRGCHDARIAMQTIARAAIAEIEGET